MAHKLLLADDSVTIQRVIELTFADEDIQVMAVGDGQQAIERIRTDRPDIILADVDMPEQDGFQVAAFVKQDPDLCHIPVVLLTGAFEPVDEERVRAAGCDGVLAKPFEPQLLIARVKELLSGAPGGPKQSDADSSAASASDQSALQAPAPLSAAESDLANLGLQPAEPAQSEGSIDEYFDRLDAAFTSRGLSPEEPAAADSWTFPSGEPEPEQPPAPPDPPADPVASSAPVRPPSVPAASAAAPNPEIADAFDWLLAAEQGEAVPARPVPAAAPPSAAAMEALVDEVTRRVIERLADSGVREQMADVVSRIAERLVRDEIERLKALVK